MSTHLASNVCLWLFLAHRHVWLYPANLLFSWRSLYRLYALRPAGQSQPPTSWVLLIDQLIDILSLIEAHKRAFIQEQDKELCLEKKCTIGRWQRSLLQHGSYRLASPLRLKSVWLKTCASLSNLHKTVNQSVVFSWNEYDTAESFILA